MARAFSLIELTAVLALSAILLSAGSLAFKEWRDSEDMTDAAQRVGSADALVRHLAESTGSADALRFDSQNGTILRDAGTEQIRLVQLPTEVRIEKILSTTEDPAGGDDDSSIAISPAGRSHSYALLLQGAADRQQWIGIAGFTGQLTLLDNEDQAQAFTIGQRSDAH